MEKNNYAIVLIRWADAHAGEGGWLSLDEYEDEGEVIVETVGFLVPADAPGGKKDHVTVWQSYHEGEGIHPFHVPCSMVRSIKTISDISI
jgi:hypothetical protein